MLTAGQAFVLTADQPKSASIIFNYQTTCAGARPGNYAGRFHKVKRIVKLGFFGAVDYALLQLNVPAAGLGITPIVMRPDLPAAGEEIFCIHHPEGAVKRLSATHAAFKTVISERSQLPSSPTSTWRAAASAPDCSMRPAGSSA